MHSHRIALASTLLAAIFFAMPATATPVPKKASQSYTAGHSELSGGNGEFGVVYSLQTRWNEEIISAQYTVDPFDRYEGCSYAKAGKKLLMLEIAVKNPRPIPQTYNDETTDSIIAFDQNGNQYPLNDYELASNGEKGFGPTLNPGQGVGHSPD